MAKALFRKKINIPFMSEKCQNSLRLSDPRNRFAMLELLSTLLENTRRSDFKILKSTFWL